MKRIILLALVILIATGIALLVFKPVHLPYEEPQPMPVLDVHEVDMCFAQYIQGDNGLEDRYTLRMHIRDTEVTGELKFIPAEKDSKVGLFGGTVGPVDKMMMARTVDALWDTFGEGMNIQEELRIVFGEGTASVGIGAMILGEDGVYRYENKDALTYSLVLSDVDCEGLTERENVLMYLREHIGELSPVKPTFGGSWYVVSYTIDTNTDTGTVLYEDGHIQEEKNFAYVLKDDFSVESITLMQ